MRNKKSFFERLTGAINADEDELEDGAAVAGGRTMQNHEKPNFLEEEETEGQLAVDVYDAGGDIIIKSMVAGVRPDDLDLTITRDMVVLRGKRMDSHTTVDENYFHKELYWGVFSRTVLLPVEVEPESAEAIERNGLLIIRLPKIDKSKQTKLRVNTT
jgi:HSP20 family protein